MTRTVNTQVDHGYAWVVVGSCFVLRLLVEGFWASAGILMLQWQFYFDVDASQTACLGSTLMMLILGTSKNRHYFIENLTFLRVL